MPTALTPAERVARHRARRLAAGGRRVYVLLEAADAARLDSARAVLGLPSDAAALVECLRRLTPDPAPGR